jgi:hypothetical protein
MTQIPPPADFLARFLLQMIALRSHRRGKRLDP